MLTWNDLRSWQKRFVTSFNSWLETNFLLVALPAGGKSIAALYAANEWRKDAANRQRLIVYVGPLDHQGWHARRMFHLFGY